MLIVTVEDDGIGMKAEDVARVFDGPIQPRDANYEHLNPYGNGIGLAFCKQVCQSLDGDITCESSLGFGSVFTFTMGMRKVEDYGNHKHSNLDNLEEQEQGRIIFKGTPEAYEEDLDELMFKDLTELKPSEENQVLTFQNSNFVFKVSRTTPVEMVRGDNLPHFENLVNFLSILEKGKLLENT